MDSSFGQEVDFHFKAYLIQAMEMLHLLVKLHHSLLSFFVIKFANY